MDNADDVPKQKRWTIVKQRPTEVVNVTLVNHNEFAQNSPINEVEVNKRGKPFLPQPQFQIQGLQKDAIYFLAIGMLRIEEHRYRHYEHAGWIMQTSNEPKPEKLKLGFHHNGMHNGKFWMSKIVTFNKLRVTHNLEEKGPEFCCVKNYYKHQPQLSIFKVVGDHIATIIGRFTFADTEFIPLAKIKNPMIRRSRPVRKYVRLCR